ncbi:unnamed protein product [Psylliodes chrysocephalus]|uniref:Uncharacterized protein n=1 Tax=Psylliodes chrysocephalus TaxID=3402493 RepID=A0A9P0G759_9CUCU|nr:unnamed protein product [Psylliodes chrysocephala]
MVRYHENLSDIDCRYPGLKQLLEKGGLSNISFAGAPIDQTLEHTVNRDSASRLTGISAMTNQASAHVRWRLTRSVRSELVIALKEMAGLNSKDDISKELKSLELFMIMLIYKVFVIY